MADRLSDPLVIYRMSVHGGSALSASGDHPAFLLTASSLSIPNAGARRLFREGHATIVHVTVTSYRERSYFDGQDVLEADTPAWSVDLGWFNRALAALLACDSRGAS